MGDEQGPDSLSARERDVVALLVRNASNQQIADELGVSVETVKSHLTSIFRKLGANSRYEILASALSDAGGTAAEHE